MAPAPQIPSGETESAGKRGAGRSDDHRGHKEPHGPRYPAPEETQGVHGIEGLRSAAYLHDRSGLVIVGAKSYGRAPTFLMATGYEQARSVVAEIAGDRKAAREVRLVLPETGVCNSDRITGPAEAAGAAGCCGGPAPIEAEACCAKDADAKAQGEAGCGCGPSSRTAARA